MEKLKEIKLISKARSMYPEILMKAPACWYEWNEVLPNKVKVKCDEVAQRYGKSLNVRRWVIKPPRYPFRACIVAETYIKQTSEFSRQDEFAKISIRHLLPQNNNLNE